MRLLRVILASFAWQSALQAQSGGERDTNQTILIKGQVPTPQVVTIRPREQPAYSRQILFSGYYDRSFRDRVEAPLVLVRGVKDPWVVMAHEAGGNSLVDITRPPALNEFPMAERQIARVNVPPENLIPRVIDALSKRSWTYDPVIHRLGSDTYLITLYNEEPDTVHSRVRSTAYRLRLTGNADGAPCTAVALSWLILSRSVRAQRWSRESAGARPRAADLSEMSGWFQDHPPCRGRRR